jgi:hypothetical protein
MENSNKGAKKEKECKRGDNMPITHSSKFSFFVGHVGRQKSENKVEKL